MLLSYSYYVYIILRSGTSVNGQTISVGIFNNQAARILPPPPAPSPPTPPRAPSSTYYNPRQTFLHGSAVDGRESNMYASYGNAGDNDTNRFTSYGSSAFPRY